MFTNRVLFLLKHIKKFLLFEIPMGFQTNLPSFTFLLILNLSLYDTTNSDVLIFENVNDMYLLYMNITFKEPGTQNAILTIR